MPISGHALSRLVSIRHNRGKQGRFPTIWKESPKHRTSAFINREVESINFSLVCLSHRVQGDYWLIFDRAIADFVAKS